MCPVCLAHVGFIAAGAASTSEVGCARRENGFMEIAETIINRTKLKEEK